MAIDKDDKDLIESSLEAKTELGKEFIRQWRGALKTRKTTKVGDYTLDVLLRECFDLPGSMVTLSANIVRAPIWFWMGSGVLAVVAMNTIGA